MASNDRELYFDPVSQGDCQVQGCSNPAKYRASWAQGVVVKLVCPTHKEGVEGKLFEELGPTMFVSTGRADHYME